MTAPPNFISLSQSFGDLETLNSLLVSSESKDREIKVINIKHLVNLFMIGIQELNLTPKGSV